MRLKLNILRTLIYLNLKTNQIFLNIEDNFCIFCNESSEIVTFKGFPICKDCICKLNILKNSKKSYIFIKYKVHMNLYLFLFFILSGDRLHLFIISLILISIY